MTDTPNYRFNRRPQFSVNHIAAYLATTNATQRKKLIRAAKFPKKVEVAAYSQVRTEFQKALTKDNFGRDDLDFLADRLDVKASRETGYPRDEALRCVKAIRAFQETFNPRSFARYQITKSSRTISTSISGVKVNVTLDASVLATKGDVTHSGGISLQYAFSGDRSAIKDRLAAASGLILWALEGGQIEPAARLCMAVDLAGRDIVKASEHHGRFRGRVSDSCSEVAAQWDAIDPPADYDGPPWR